MRYANLIFGILLSAAMASGCATIAEKKDELMTGRKISIFDDLGPGEKTFNRGAINRLAEDLFRQGFRGDDAYSSIDEEEYFEAATKEANTKHRRLYKIDQAECNQHARRAGEAARFKPTQHANDGSPAASATALINLIGAVRATPFAVAGQAFDECMIGKGWEVNTTKAMQDAVKLAFTRVSTRARQSVALAAKPPKEANVAERVFENAWPSVVVIKSGQSQGSGVVIRPNIVATNCHVVDSGSIVVYKTGDRRALTDSSFAATIHHRDTARDFCLLDVAGLWGIPADIRAYNTLKVGEDVYALGAPTGLDLSLSSGVISQLRKITIGRVIQTDAAISPGSSGGGLFDSDGNLIGITTAKRVAEDVEGIGFAIPADLAAEL